MTVDQASSLASQASQEAPVQTWVWLLLVASTGVACVTDLRSMRIPNWLTIPLLAGGLIHAGMGGGWHGVLLSVGASAVAGFVFVVGYMFFRGGAGDAKLMLAIGSWIDFDHAMLLMMAVTIAGFLQAMVVVVARGSVADIPFVIFDGWWKVLSKGKRFLRGGLALALDAPATSDVGVDEEERKARLKGWFPYAPAILLGTVAAWWYSVKFGGFR